MKKHIRYVFLLMCFVVPGIALAAAGDFDQVGGFMDGLSGFISGKLVPFVFTLGLLVFIYGIFQYFIIGGADEGSREKGKKLMLWAIIGFVVMVSIWGIVNIFSTGLGLNNELRSDDIPKGPGGVSTDRTPPPLTRTPGPQ
ncbi:MAG: ribose/xylose/arabinose/galactoside ABC-type transport system permease subunit [Acidimicrobiales bacterium]|jgi:ribose/xylose/arabinose/galactoside ABC-type transport system permease subunit